MVTKEQAYSVLVNHLDVMAWHLREKNIVKGLELCSFVVVTSKVQTIITFITFDLRKLCDEFYTYVCINKQTEINTLNVTKRKI